jgi:hypothetical protein
MAQKKSAILISGLLVLLFSGCTTVRIVQPYDDRLFDETETFFKNADAMVERGKSVSPRSDAERAAIVEPTKHPGHISAFESKYDELLVDSDALILRAIVNGQVVDYLGSKIGEKINAAIESSLPSVCEEVAEAAAAKMSLTAMNFVDLKCIVIKWKEEHGDKELTDGKSILKKVNWEGRKIALFTAILSIQKAEGFKKNK